MRHTLESIKHQSDDQNTQTAAILTDPDGRYILGAANTLTAGVEVTTTRTTRPDKGPWIEHAERNVIFKAARLGIKTEGLHLHMRWFPCAECARAIVQAGIVVLHCDPQPDQCEKYHFTEAAEILSAAGVTVRRGLTSTE